MKKIYAQLVLWVGDNKEQNIFGGFRGNSVCRHCYANLRDSLQGLSILNSILRTVKDTNRILTDMDKHGAEFGHRKGINGRNHFNLEGFNFIEQMGQDTLMHDELEGIYACVC